MQNVRKTNNSPRGTISRQKAHGIEGLGLDKTAYLMHGPIRGFSAPIGDPANPYKTEAQARKDWKVYRKELMALEKDLTRRPWAYWEYELDMDCPLGGDQAEVIMDLELYRNEGERKFLEVWLTGNWIEALKIRPRE